MNNKTIDEKIPPRFSTTKKSIRGALNGHPPKLDALPPRAARQQEKKPVPVKRRSPEPEEDNDDREVYRDSVPDAVHASYKGPGLIFGKEKVEIQTPHGKRVIKGAELRRVINECGSRDFEDIVEHVTGKRGHLRGY